MNRSVLIGAFQYERTRTMKRRTKMLGVLGLLLVTGLAMGKDQPKPANGEDHQMPAIKPPASFNHLKQLAGKWKGTKVGDNDKQEVEVEYTLTAAGTALAEKLFAGTPHEMLTVYHGDKGGLVMTHYCAMGNQPRMRLKKSNSPKTFKFVFVDGTSMESAGDPHMHQLTMTIVDKNHLTHEWVFYQDSKPKETVRFNFVRRG